MIQKSFDDIILDVDGHLFFMIVMPLTEDIREMYHLAGSGIESKISGIGEMVATTIVPYII